MIKQDEVRLEEIELLTEIRRIKRKYCGSEAELVPEDARDYETGLSARLLESKSPIFRHVIPHYLKAKSILSRRSRAEYGTYLRKVMRKAEGISESRLSEIKTEHWYNIIRNVYPTPAGRNKARRLLHGLYEYAMEQSWVSYNPICAVKIEATEQQKIKVLQPHQIKALLTELQKPTYAGIAVTVGFLLWEGIRLADLRQLRWEKIKIHQLNFVLQRWLDKFPIQYHGSVVPRNWIPRWRKLREAVGLVPWQNDTLQHTYAAYHLCFHRNPNLLTEKFKRMSAQEISARFSNASDISHQDAAEYWSGAWFQEK